jgi:hypothetical protein
VRGLASLALFVFASQTLGAQVSATVDLNASDIRYDQFQSSTALAISPTVTFDQGWTSIAARSTALWFESGHRDLHGSLLGTTFTPPVGPFRLEVGADLGASRYLSLPTFTHYFAAADLHYLKPHYGAWLGGTAGQTSFGVARRGAGTAGLGVWAATSWVTLTATASRSSIGDTSYTDLQGTSRLTRGRLAFDGRLGTRVGSTGGGHGVFGEAALTYTLTRLLGVTIGAGRYPTDPTRGTIAGRYVTAGIRIGIRGAAPPNPYREALTTSVDVGPGELRLHAEGATRVEVMGDFTDWQPVEAAKTRSGMWLVKMAISPGPHRLEVRINGGPWMAPVGATQVKDEFGGEAGLIVVP